MLRGRLGLGVLCVAVFAFGTNAVAADDKAPDPLKVLKKATRNLVKEAKTSGYRTGVEVSGGLSKTADHQLHMTTVRETYTGDVRGNVMHVPDMKVYRTSSKGALFDGVQWYALQARPEGKKLDRLFAFPVHLLATALQKPERIEWLTSTEQGEETEEEEIEGHTVVVRKKSKEKVYHRMRVQVPDEEALQYFIEVQNSGCLSGG